jgi:hypothetical protein
MCLGDMIYSYCLRGEIEEAMRGGRILWSKQLWEHWNTRLGSFADQLDTDEACRALA